MTRSAQGEYWNDLARHDGGSAIAEIWLSHPLVRRTANKRISGDEDVWPTDWLHGRLTSMSALPIPFAASVGCGTGAFERDIVQKGIAQHVTGIDLAAEPIRRALELASEMNLSSSIDYIAGDAREFLKQRTARFDAIFFHESLHHFDNLADLLATVRSALRPGGLLYIDEYVGPARNEWTWRKLLLANLAYYSLPRSVRRPRLVRAPINREDPTEAIASSSILKAVSATFNVIESRSYGGNLLAIIYPNLLRTAQNNSQRRSFDKAVSRLIAFEDVLLKLRRPSFYVVALAQPRVGARVTS